MSEIELGLDTSGFAREVETMRRTLEEGLGGGAERAGRLVETSLLRAVRTGKLGFEDLKRSALAALESLAASAIRQGVGAIFGSIGLPGALPGRATGGGVTAGRPYLVGERGPETFVPTSTGTIVPGGPVGGGAREVRVSIRVEGPGDAAPERLARSSRQVARAVRDALQDG